jgi:DNA polymerase-3 subunit epsilon
MIIGEFFTLDYRRRRLARKSPPGPLRSFLSVPFPAPRSDCREVEYVAVDLETTGLDPRLDEIITVGLVCLTGLRIDLSTAQHRYVLPSREIPEQSAVIHKITDDRAAAGESLAEVLTELFSLLAGKVMIAHHARFELQFLNAACERVFGGKFLIPVIDTQWIMQRWLERRDRAYSAKDLRLAAIRERYGLPQYRAHNALSDALASAELFIAQVGQQGTDRSLPLKQFLFRH